MLRIHPKWRYSLILTLTMFFTACAARQTGPLQAGEQNFPQPSGYDAFSPEQEVQIGKQAAAQADAQLPELPASSPISQYISQLGQKLASQLPQNPYQFNFKVVNQKEINAFALPGGPVRVNLGTIQAADSEAELAGVIAHEISHVWMRHATRNASKEQIAQIPAAILGGIVGNGVGGQLARLGLQFGLGSVFLKYSRDAESEADRTGAKIMYDAGYDPEAMAKFFKKLEEQGGPGGPQFLSDHPDPGNRAQAVMTEISQLPPKHFITNSPQFARIHQLAMKEHPLTAQQIAQQQQQKQPNMGQIDPREVMPSGSFQTYNGSVFQMEYPSNWKVMGDQNSGAVTIAPQAGVSQNAIAYGVVVSIYQPQAQESLDQATQQIYQGLQQSNPQIQAVGNPEQMNGSVPMEAVHISGPSPLSENGQQVAEHDILVTAQRNDGTVLWMLFITPEPQYNQLKGTYQRMVQSLKLS